LHRDVTAQKRPSLKDTAQKRPKKEQNPNYVSNISGLRSRSKRRVATWRGRRETRKEREERGRGREREKNKFRARGNWGCHPGGNMAEYTRKVARRRQDRRTGGERRECQRGRGREGEKEKDFERGESGGATWGV